MMGTQVELSIASSDGSPARIGRVDTGPDSLSFTFDAQRAGPYSVSFKLTGPHVLGRPLSILTAKKAAPNQVGGDTFLSSDDEADTRRPVHKAGGGAPRANFDVPKEDKPHDNILQFMPVHFKPTPQEDTDSERSAVKSVVSEQISAPGKGLGRGRAALGGGSEFPGTHRGQDGEESWDVPSSSAPKSSGLRAGLYDKPKVAEQLPKPAPVAVPTPPKPAPAAFDRQDPKPVLENMKPKRDVKESGFVADGQCGSSSPSWLPPKKRDVMSLLGNGEMELWGITQLQLGICGVSEDRENHFNQPTAVCINERNGDLIVCDSRNRLVKIFKCSGVMRALIGNKIPTSRHPFNDPSGCVIISGEEARDDRVIVKCENGIHIIVYDPEGNPAAAPDIVHTVEANGADNYLRSPMGLALTKNRLIVTISNAKAANRSTEIMFIDPESGDLVRRIPFQPSQGFHPGGHCSPRFIDVWENRIVVSDLGLNKIYVISLDDGSVLNEFGGLGRGPGKFSFASGIAIDGAGNMLIGDAKANRIMLFNADGEFQQVLKFQKAEEADVAQLECPFPAGVSLSMHGHLMFTSRGPQGQVVSISLLEGRPRR